MRTIGDNIRLVEGAHGPVKVRTIQRVFKSMKEYYSHGKEAGMGGTWTVTPDSDFSFGFKSYGSAKAWITKAIKSRYGYGPVFLIYVDNYPGQKLVAITVRN